MLSTKIIVTLLGIICYISHIRTMNADGPEEEAEKKCKEEYKVDESVFVNDGKADGDNFDIILKDESNENDRCFVQCLMEGFGYIKDGELDQEFIVGEVQKEFQEEGVEIEETQLREHIATCAKKTGEEKCNTPYQILKCLFDLSKQEKHK